MAGSIGWYSPSNLREKEILLNTAPALGVTSEVKPSPITAGSSGVGVNSSVGVTVGVLVIVGVCVIVGVDVMVGVFVGVGDGSKNLYVAGSANPLIRKAITTITTAKNTNCQAAAQ